ADPAYRAGTAVEARRSRSPQWVQGRADRRRRRRGVRRLRHVQGGKAAPLLCAAAALRPAAAAAPQALSLPAGPPGAVAEISRSVFWRGPRRDGRSALFAPAALAHHGRREGTLLRHV